MAFDLTPVEMLLREIRTRHPEVAIERLQVKHVGDDDNLWFVKDGDVDVQFDCHPGGLPPFLVEGGDDERITARDVDEAIAAIDGFWL